MNYNNLKLKILTLGESAVGKSSIIVRYKDDKFNPSHTTTLGVELVAKKIKINDQQIQLQIWDTAGQERFRTITPVYYKCVQGVILVFSLIDRDSFENVQYWMSKLQEYADNDKIKIILVGNKCDLPDRVVTTEEAEQYASEINCTYYESSAKTNKNISAIFEDLAEQIMKTVIIDQPQEKDENIKLQNNDNNIEKKKKKNCC